MIWVQTLTLPLTSCVTSGELFTISLPLFVHLWLAATALTFWFASMCVTPFPPHRLASNEENVERWWGATSEVGLHRDRDFCPAFLSVLFCLFWWKPAAMLRDAMWRGTHGKELKVASGQHPTRTWGPQCPNLQRSKSCQLPLEWGWTWPQPCNGCSLSRRLECSFVRAPE